MSATASFSHGIAGRYATALFELAKETKKLSAVEKDLASLGATIEGSSALQDVIASPVHTREEQGGVMAAVAKKLKLSPNVANTIALMASKRRLFALPAMIASVSALIAEEKGEVTADVTSAKKLTAAQSKKLAETLKKKFGKDITISATVDESIIGGLVVRVGSQMIDTSIATKLSKLQNAMKEVG